MSTATVARPAAEPRTLPPQWRRSFTLTMSICLYVSAWAVPIMLVIAAAATIIYRQFTIPDVSAVQFGQQAGIWFPFSLMIMCGVLTPTVIMGGLTRRSHAVGSLVTAVTLAAMFAIGLVGALLLESWIFASLGWNAGLVNDPNVLAASEPAQLALNLFLLFAAANIAGLLVHLAYYRLGALQGTVSLPLTLSPVLLVGLFGISPEGPGRPWGPSSENLPNILNFEVGIWHPVIALAIILLASLVHLGASRGLAIHPKES